MDINGKYLAHGIIQGGMGVGVSLSELAGNVAKQGCMGVISSVNIGFKEKDFLTNPFEANIRALKKHIVRAKEIAGSNGLVGVNIMVAVSHYEETVKAAISAGADAIISGAGLPLNLAELVKGTNTLYAPIVSSAKAAMLLCRTFAKKAQSIPDFIVIEGYKAGGHLGFSADDLNNQTCQDNLEILKEVKETIKPFEEQFKKKIKVFLGGGIFTGKDMAEAIQTGADGVQIGTRFIATKECDANNAFKEVLINASEDDIRIIKSPVGMPARAIFTPMLESLENGKTFFAKKCNGCLKACPKGDKIPYCISRALIAAVEGNREEGLFFCGENAARIDKITTVKDLVDEIITEYQSSMSTFNMA
ncbi:NAD(P)H-dependent flavin oxidoreductase YrpB, nitropropane dioxygenase family [Pseudobutyrivibrio sp. ACV-2]|uniref:NAD(P)H-dependent flavin oxidoreductase n=1 Tax=Pseudobutyrivibrio sp. ACV-2 TaxID=1520801 RepID=UPI000898E376|nr:nitronate monooxygenase [Pseudobutyrivibrio sp. ACV-2]SEB02316.1 NAD(P)H-dependent flavin oxidoreductase YrpB, nitropropane dioxygenase family [Pseudobutyrivibrio sp. ACV-2]